MLQLDCIVDFYYLYIFYVYLVATSSSRAALERFYWSREPIFERERGSGIEGTAGGALSGVWAAVWNGVGSRHVCSLAMASPAPHHQNISNTHRRTDGHAGPDFATGSLFVGFGTVVEWAI